MPETEAVLSPYLRPIRGVVNGTRLPLGLKCLKQFEYLSLRPTWGARYRDKAPQSIIFLNMGV
jgi:hypothetical protein